MAGGIATTTVLGNAKAEKAEGLTAIFRSLLVFIAFTFIALFIVVPLVNVFVQAFAHGWSGYIRTFFAAPPPHGVHLPVHQRLELLRNSSRAARTRSSIEMTLFVGAIAVTLNTIFGVAAA